MGLILCMAADPASYLTIPELSVRVFSSEELCYCILKYPLLFLEDFLDDGVFRFLGTVTGDVRFKAELRDMKENGIKDEEIILEALFQCTKPSGVPRGPSHLQFPWPLRATMRNP